MQLVLALPLMLHWIRVLFLFMFWRIINVSNTQVAMNKSSKSSKSHNKSRKRPQGSKKANSRSKSAKKSRKSLATQVFEYMITGGVWFWSGYLLIICLDEPLGLFAANLVGNAVGITLNFILERYWVFRTKKPAKLGIMAWRYVTYTAVNAFGLNYLILYSLREFAGVQPEIGQFIASGFFTVWNFYWYKTWVFKGAKRPKRSRHHA